MPLLLFFTFLILAAPLSAKSEAPAPPTVALLNTEAASILLEPRISTFDALLFAELSARPEIFLVEREELGSALDEFRLHSQAGTSATHAVLVGRWMGAGIVISPRAVARGPGLTVATRILGVDTGAVLVTETAMDSSDRFAAGARELAAAIATIIREKHARLLPPPFDEPAQLQTLRALFNNRAPPDLSVAVREIRGPDVDASTMGNPIIAEELSRIWQALDGRTSSENNNDHTGPSLLIRLEARSSPGPRHGDFISGRAQLSITAVDRASGRELHRDRQTEIALETSETLAFEVAQRRAARVLAFRLLRTLAEARRP